MTMRRSDKHTVLDYFGNPAVTEPFGVPRSAARLLFDFSVMAACLNLRLIHSPILDFGAGSGWITELLARMGHRVVAFDIHGDLEGCLQHRIDADLRVRPELISFQHGDGHAMPFSDCSFGHIFCYDTLHHMHDYFRVFTEFRRVLEPGGRIIFVEPGARHSSSPETIEFLRQQKAHDQTWIERDVVPEEIDKIAHDVGLTGLTLLPMPHPDSPISFTLSEWQSYRSGRGRYQKYLAERMSDINYNERLIFYCDRLL